MLIVKSNGRRWLLDTNDMVKVKSCYNELSGIMTTVPYAFIWSLSIPLQVKIRSLLAVFNRLSTKVNMAELGVLRMI